MLKLATLITGLQKQLSDLNLENRNIKNPGMSLLRVFFVLRQSLYLILFEIYNDHGKFVPSLSKKFSPFNDGVLGKQLTFVLNLKPLQPL